MPRKIRELKAQIASREFIQYSMIIQWSDRDKLFLVTIPEFEDRVVMPCTYGRTREEAIRNAEEVIEMYLEAWQAEGEAIPKPSLLQIA